MLTMEQSTKFTFKGEKKFVGIDTHKKTGKWEFITQAYR